MKRLLRALEVLAWFAFFAFAALVLALRYWVLPDIERYRPDIVAAISRAVGLPPQVPEILGSNTYRGAIRYTETFGIDALRFCQSLKEALVKLGVEIYEGSRAREIVADGVVTEAGKKITAKNEVLAEMSKSWAHSRAQVAGADVSKLTGRYKPWDATLAEAAFVMSGDLHEHLGQLIAYARMNGVTPPWSKK